MKIVTTINDWQIIRQQLTGKSIGFVPTMGHLHAGHISLCERSRVENDITVVSIFVNPTQFNQGSDFQLYPRTIEQDKSLLVSHQIDYLFLPDAESMYADHYEVQVTETALSHELEGEFRPGHFTGMLTVVLKLLNLVQAARAYFGEKDYQQLLLVKKMVAALFLPTEIIACETLRADDGLALSSRNSRLNAAQRQKAAHFPHLLQSDAAIEKIIAQLQALGFKVDYIADQWQRRLGAVWLDDVRLIDNISIKKE
ncbi:MAG: pantoate--beta-alanine ligase [Gammaproteobacteria bacterium]|nr:MAG: pantoate--beta-alanine ligase [Gammaproteobacteria bacterium]